MRSKPLPLSSISLFAGVDERKVPTTPEVSMLVVLAEIGTYLVL